MKNVGILMLALIGFSSVSAQGEQTVKMATDIVYYGIDFTRLTVIGEEVYDPNEYINRYFMGWNGVVRNEREKYKIGEVFKKANVEYDLEMIDPLNAARDPKTIIGTKPITITEEDIVSIVKDYDMSQTEGVGLVIIAENFNKMAQEGTMWVVFFDINTNTILMAHHMSAKPMGFGVKNFWIRTVYNVLQDCKSQYPKWVK
jgi:hypothetical protein